MQILFMAKKIFYFEVDTNYKTPFIKLLCDLRSQVQMITNFKWSISNYFLNYSLTRELMENVGQSIRIRLNCNTGIAKCLVPHFTSWFSSVWQISLNAHPELDSIFDLHEGRCFSSGRFFSVGARTRTEKKISGLIKRFVSRGRKYPGAAGFIKSCCAISRVNALENPLKLVTFLITEDVR